jgi:hypothetical protein
MVTLNGHTGWVMQQELSDDAALSVARVKVASKSGESAHTIREIFIN